MMFRSLVGLLCLCCLCSTVVSARPIFPRWPYVVHIGAYEPATLAAYNILQNSTDATDSTISLNAITAGITQCEVDQCWNAIGYGNNPDESGEVTLDALIIDGVTLDVGAVADLRNIRNAIGVARAVMDYTEHTMLAGESATQFAQSVGFPFESLSTSTSTQTHNNWLNNNCQPNFWKNYQNSLTPNPATSCGPYSHNETAFQTNLVTIDGTQTPIYQADQLDDQKHTAHKRPRNHQHHQTASRRSRRSRSRSRSRGSSSFEATPDTPSLTPYDVMPPAAMSMIVIDAHGHMAAGTSSNGKPNHIAGLVDGASIAGTGVWVDSDWGGCGATGDLDILQRFAPCFIAVQNLRAGHTPAQAAADSLGRIERFFEFKAGLIVVDRVGNHGGAAHGMNFTYTVFNGQMSTLQTFDVIHD